MSANSQYSISVPQVCFNFPNKHAYKNNVATSIEPEKIAFTDAQRVVLVGFLGESVPRPASGNGKMDTASIYTEHDNFLRFRLLEMQDDVVELKQSTSMSTPTQQTSSAIL